MSDVAMDCGFAEQRFSATRTDRLVDHVCGAGHAPGF